MISGHQEFFLLAIWWAGYLFPFFPMSFLLHLCCMKFFFFRQALAGNFFSKSPTPPPPQELNGRPLNSLISYTLFLLSAVLNVGQEV